MSFLQTAATPVPAGKILIVDDRPDDERLLSSLQFWQDGDAWRVRHGSV